VLLYDVPEVITSLNFQVNDLTWVRRQSCLADLGSIHPEVFVDACLLAGTSFLPTFPPLKSGARRLKAAVDLIMGTTGKTGYVVCLQYQDEPAGQYPDEPSGRVYLDKYMRAKLSVKHHVVMTKDGKVEPFNAESAPGDIHEFISNRLPDEFYYYLSRGVIGPRVLNWMVSGQIFIAPPLDLGESPDYQHLIKDQLNPIRSTTLKLLASANHRFYQHSKYTVRCWFEPTRELSPFEIKDIEDPGDKVYKWNVHEAIYGPEKNKYLVCISLDKITVD
jgi:hypothetical protein